MRNLPRPKFDDTTDFEPAQLYKICISKIRNKVHRRDMERFIDIIDQAEARYNEKGYDSKLFELDRIFEAGKLTSTNREIKAELIKTYDQRLVKANSPGRNFYNSIILTADRICPLCGDGPVNSLDHHLPKEHYSVYSVSPMNLVPVCDWCQKAKGVFYPQREEEQLIHPYFDDFDRDVWLASKIDEGNPAVFIFRSEPPANWSDAKKERVSTHMKRLKLSELYTIKAGQKLTSIRARLHKLLNAGSSDSVISHLKEELESLENVHRNSWEAAMYRAAINNAWFCNGGFNNT